MRRKHKAILWLLAIMCVKVVVCNSRPYIVFGLENGSCKGKLHSDDLTEYMDDIRNECFEYGALFNMNGDRLYEVAGTSVHVTISGYNIRRARYLANDGLVLVHNHPTSGLDDSFSIQDIAFASDFDITRMILVKEGYDYVLEAREEWPSRNEMTEFLKAQYGFDFDEMRVTDAQLFQVMAIDAGKIKSVAMGDSIVYYTTDAFVASFAKEFDLHYTVVEEFG